MDVTISQPPPLSPTSSSSRISTSSSSVDTTSHGTVMTAGAGARRNNGEQTKADRRTVMSPAELAERKRKDEYLLWAKDIKGWTYSEIKKAGGFTEAESTLRGRYRMLHKRPEERIRKPKWTGVDVRSFAFRLSPKGLADLSAPTIRIPWGKVSEYIATHGGTYRFGNSTCKKKWLALVEEQVGRLGKAINEPFLEDLFHY
ncbi:hypothetical protein QBC37DRAFT_453957 [Rhypophila decipiens]|uniref:Myb-like domain-containing protein n=1 Tax=Rhypophila decipiens TaxID=261697 RepID=A0AAN6XW54_9PEZI|nr:hypothetical protein QBC37DRAFT_453957 [Rhypophila decipiens]